MASVRPRHAVLTGAPGAGKTTLLAAAALDGFAVSQEVARDILQRPGGMALRAGDPRAFAETMIAAHLAELDRTAVLDGLVIFDRGLPDVAGFLAVSGYPVSAAIDAICRTRRYHGPILRAPFWPEIYRQDAERIQSPEEAEASDRAVSAAWRRYGYDVVDLPLAPVSERLEFLRKAMGV